MLVQGQRDEMKLGFLSKLPKQKLQKIVLVCIVSLAAVVGVIEFYVLKNWNALTEAEASIGKLNDQIQQAQRKARDAKQDVAYRAQVKSFVETQQATMISGDPFAWVVREISLFAEQHPVRMGALHPGSKVESGGNSKSPTYSTHLEFSGSYDQIGEFVQDLENRFPTAEIQSLLVSGSADDKSDHSASLQIVLRVQPAAPSRKVEAKKQS
jgi:Tfp pilus assembly protein PilO